MRAQGGSAFGPPDWLSRVFIAGGWVDVRHNWDSSLSLSLPLSLPLLSVLLAFLLLCFTLQLSVFVCYALPLATWLIAFLLGFYTPNPLGRCPSVALCAIIRARVFLPFERSTRLNY